jgi:hypothetical protein
MLGGSDDDILPGQRQRHDVDGGFVRLEHGQPDALELLAVERPTIRSVRTIRPPESEPVDQHHPSVFGQP